MQRDAKCSSFLYLENDKEILLDYLEDLAYVLRYCNSEDDFLYYDKEEMKHLILEHHDLFMGHGKNT